MPNKYIGVSTPHNSNPSWQQLFNDYGFTQVEISGPDEYEIADNIGFEDNNIMVGSSRDYTDYLVENLNMVGYYHINEPYERGTFNLSDIVHASIKIAAENPTAKLFLSSYKWPTWFYSFPTLYGEVYSQALIPVNTFIKCDQYEADDYFGDSRDYWYEYVYYYGLSNIYTNWMEINRSVGQFQELFGYANNHSMNRLWLWAGTQANPTPEKFTYFCRQAWATFWLRGFAQYYQIVYRCQLPDPCDCDPNSDEFWYVDEIYEYTNVIEVYPY